MIAGSAPELREVARYGTLIDWETGILAGLRAALTAHRVDGTDADQGSPPSFHRSRTTPR
ncbi:MAG TPA: hypothetical protein VIK38_15735 [Coriobacteriia bacterium]|jgi:hypothetical protein